LLTGTSLLLAYRILRLDQLEKRRTQASMVTFTANPHHDIGKRTLSTVVGAVYNNSDAPIMHLYITVEMKEPIASGSTRDMR